MTALPEGWDALLGRPFDREPCRGVLAAAEAEASRGTVYPPREDWFAAFRLTPPQAVRVVILGQDPYHEPGQAMGLAFSVRKAVKLPPSLRNIYKELEADLGLPAPESGDLTPWAEQGVLLLNTVLTVAAGRANSHKDLLWQRFTGGVIAACAALPQPVAFVLWGAPAQKAFSQAAGNRHQESGIRHQGTWDAPGTGKREPGTGEAFPLGERRREAPDKGTVGVKPGPRLILKAPHPSPLSAYRGFFGSRPFSQINSFLTASGEAPILWAGVK